MSLIEAVIAQHAEEVPFLWQLRTSASGAPHYRLRNLTELDDRIEAHLDGLRIAEKEVWGVCDEIWTLGDAGEVFAALELSCDLRDADRTAAVLSAAASNPTLARGAVSALGWLEPGEAWEQLSPLLRSEDPNVRAIGVAAGAVHRIDLGEELAAAVQSGSPLLAARACRAAGELGRTDLLPHLREGFLAPDEDTRFWACWSGALFGDMTAVAILKSFVGSPIYADRAVGTAIRRMPGAAAEGWLAELAASPALVRAAIGGLGAFGDPVAVPLLVELMEAPDLARVAGESFSLLSGVDLAGTGLAAARPEGIQTGPTDDPEDPDVALDSDESLPWPDPKKVAGWWSQHRGSFPTGVRHLLGRPITEENLGAALRTGYQRQRSQAALELALLSPGRPLFETRAPGFRQQQWLGG